MKSILSLVLLFALACYSETLFEVKDASNNTVLEVSTDGLRIFNEGDTLMVISSSEIKAFIEQDGNRALSRAFSVTTSSSTTKGQNKVFKIGTDEGATFYNPLDNTDEIFSISKSGITANVNPALNRDFVIDDQVSAAKAGGGNLMKVSNKATFETVNDSTMLWYKQKNAFRVGHVNITSSDSVGQASFTAGSANKAIGDYSVAMGRNNRAAGFSSFALGLSCSSTGDASIAIGGEANSSANGSVAIGSLLTSSGINSTSFGYGCSAEGHTSTAFGYNNIASGGYSTAFGSENNVSGFSSTALGYNTSSTGIISLSTGSNTLASGHYSSSFGSSTTAQSFCSVVIGRNNLIQGDKFIWQDTDPLFVIGNGASEASLSNAFEVKKNGETYIPSLYNTTSASSKKVLYVDYWGKLCVASKEGGDDSGEIGKLKEENRKLQEELLFIKKEIDILKQMVQK